MAAAFFGNKTDVEVETLLGCNEGSGIYEPLQGVILLACSFIGGLGGLGGKLLLAWSRGVIGNEMSRMAVLQHGFTAITNDGSIKGYLGTEIIGIGDER